jgi:hypothetical protein
LHGVPVALREPLLATYTEIVSNYMEHRWEPSELNGEKFCEVVYSIVDGSIKGNFPAKPIKPSNMRDACQALERATPNGRLVGDRSFRILIPRLLTGLYEIRNNRGVGHVGGDVNPNLMDATAVYNLASWILAELVRIFHGLTTKAAREIVETLVERKSSLIWEVGDVKRILDPKMPVRQQVLVLLHQKHSWISVRDLVLWIEYSNTSVFRSKVLRPLHNARLIEFNEKNDQARISPLGIREAEEDIIRSKSV